MPLKPEDLINRHDPHIPAWGPYSKRYIGISHCSDLLRGLRFDLSVFPGLYRRATRLPNVRTESGYHPWEASPNLEFTSHRHELIWKDQLYYDISFARVAENARWIDIQAVNRGHAPENTVLHLMANLNYPEASALARAEVPAGARLIHALDYGQLTHREDDPRRGLQWDGQKRGEVAAPGALKGYALRVGDGEAATVSWRLEDSLPAQTTLTLRYRAKGAVTLCDQDGRPLARLPASAAWSQQQISLDRPGATLTLQIEACDELLLDALILSDNEQAGGIRFEEIRPETRPEIVTVKDNAVLLRYRDLDFCYGLIWPNDVASELRSFATDTLDELFRETLHNHVTSHFSQGDNPDNYFVNVFMRPLCLPANSQKRLHALVCHGSEAEVRQLLDDFEDKVATYRRLAEECQSRCYDPDLLPGGDTYLFSQKRLAATTLTNVVFPIRTRGQYIRHYTPGRWWDSLYTWDSGCIGIGQLETDLDRAIDNLNAYLTEPDDDEAAFIHHGSPIPTQFLVFHGIWNRTQNRDLLAYFYPRLKRYHDFLMGRAGGSTTRRLKSGLIQTWDYFYNSGGWDDYPPQKQMHRDKLAARTTPVVNTAFAIRTAKILLQAARSLGLPTAEHEADIEDLTAALQQHSWDQDAGYFSYVLHDEQGRAVGHYRHVSGENFNRGLDGVSPLIGHACTPDQQDVLVGKLMDGKALWCKAGLSTVDQGAAYYRPDGYWNGAVWMPHQWFIWKALLDYGKVDEARRIAVTALDLWANEVGESYNCFEHFIVETGRGAGWHHFSGLSSPALSWFASYYTPGKLTTGFNAWVEHQQVSPACDRIAAGISFLDSPNPPALLVTLKPEHTYRLWVNGMERPFQSPRPGLLEIVLDKGCRQAELRLEPAGGNGDMS